MMLDKTFIWSQGYNSEEKSLYYDLGIHQLESFDQLQSWFDKGPKGGGFHLTAWATAIRAATQRLILTDSFKLLVCH